MGKVQAMRCILVDLDLRLRCKGWDDICAAFRGHA